jgi:membrane-associated PAP2 superfamily phosphatase
MVTEIQRNHLYCEETPPGLFAGAYFGSGGAAAGFLVSIPFALLTDAHPYIFWIVLPVASGIALRVMRRRAVIGSES